MLLRSRAALSASVLDHDSLLEAVALEQVVNLAKRERAITADGITDRNRKDGRHGLGLRCTQCGQTLLRRSVWDRTMQESDAERMGDHT